MAIARYLIGTKLAGQADVARWSWRAASAAETITRIGGDLVEHRRSRRSASSKRPPPTSTGGPGSPSRLEFIGRDDDKVPLTGGASRGGDRRVNPGTARNATDPAQRSFQLDLSTGRGGGKFGHLALGLDPGLGILHADMRNRDGFVLDLIESCRPIADRYVARLVEGIRFDASTSGRTLGESCGCSRPFPTAWPGPCPPSVPLWPPMPNTWRRCLGRPPPMT